MCLDGEVSAAVDVVSAVPQNSVLGTLLFLFYPAEFTNIDGHRIVGCADDSTINAVIHWPLLPTNVMGSLNQNLAAIDSW